MHKPKGGRGKRAPYQTVQVRVPEPIKPQVEKLIAEYRIEVLSESEEDRNEIFRVVSNAEVLAAIKLVDKFVEEIGQTEHLRSKTRRDNRNLAKFRDWLVSQAN